MKGEKNWDDLLERVKLSQYTLIIAHRAIQLTTKVH